MRTEKVGQGQWQRWGYHVGGGVLEEAGPDWELNSGNRMRVRVGLVASSTRVVVVLVVEVIAMSF
jgi:hypothetical protein